MAVDVSRGEHLSISLDVTLHHMPCSWLTLDVMDVSGEAHLDVSHQMYKLRLSPDGLPIGEAIQHAVGEKRSEKDLHHNARVVGKGGNGGGGGDAAGDGNGARNATAGGSSDWDGDFTVRPDGSRCGSCYGAALSSSECCDTCDEVRAAYARRGWSSRDALQTPTCAHDGYLGEVRREEGEGCRLFGTVEVNKVAGNVHIAPGKSFTLQGGHAHDLSPFVGKTLDFAHTTNELAFGAAYPGRRNPLDGVRLDSPTPEAFRRGDLGIAPQKAGAGSDALTGGIRAQEGGRGRSAAGRDAQRAARGGGSASVTTSSSSSSQRGTFPPSPSLHPRVTGQFEHFVKVVPSSYAPLRGQPIRSNQFSVTSGWRPAGEASMDGELPGLFFFYDLSPIRITYEEKKKSLLGLLTSVCAIVGGVFTVSGIVDATLYHANRAVRIKLRQGKQV